MCLGQNYYLPIPVKSMLLCVEIYDLMVKLPKGSWDYMDTWCLMIRHLVSNRTHWKP